MKKLMLIGILLLATNIFSGFASADMALYNPANAPKNGGCPPSVTPIYCSEYDFNCIKTYSNSPSYTSAQNESGQVTFCHKISAFDSAKNLIKPKILVVYAANFLIECFVAYIFVLLTKKSKQIVAGVFLVNLISWPIFEFVHYIYPGTMVVVIGEILIWLFEAAGICAYSRRYIKLPSALLLSLITNAISLSLGFIFLF